MAITRAMMTTDVPRSGCIKMSTMMGAITKNGFTTPWKKFPFPEDFREIMGHIDDDGDLRQFRYLER